MNAADHDAGTRPAPAGDGERLHRRIVELYPVCRSITGDGVRRTLDRIGSWIPLSTTEVPSGTRVFDWTVPPEWNVRDAWVKDERGERVIDFRASNLHVLGYSAPFRGVLTREELLPHLHSLPDHPGWIPYRTSYYSEDWGFCLEHRRLQGLAQGRYEVCIDSTLAPGSLTYGECLLPGARDEEILVSTHVCHPSLCNDNLSGIVVAAALAEILRDVARRFSYRFLFIPGTIGSIAWLAGNPGVIPRIRHGLVLAGVGDRGPLHYKKTRRGDAAVDRAAAHVLLGNDRGGRILDFSPYGYDERQYNSPGFDLPVGCLMRTPFGRYPEYHTSADDPGFVDPGALADSVDACLEIFRILEENVVYVNLHPFGEPQLGRRGLYDTVGGRPVTPEDRLAMLWVLNQSDGSASLLDIAERAGLSFAAVRQAASVLEDHRLVRPVRDGVAGPGSPT